MTESKYTQKVKPIPPVRRAGDSAFALPVDQLKIQVQVEPINTRGMPKVTQTKSVTKTSSDNDSQDIKLYIQPHAKALVDRLLGLALDEGVKENVALAAINALLDRGFGKPSQVVETTSTIADLTSLHLDALRKSSR